MEQKDNDTLESIIRAAKTMTKRYTKEQEATQESKAKDQTNEEPSDATLKLSIPSKEEELEKIVPNKVFDCDSNETINFSDTSSLLSAALTFSETLQTASIHFLEFSVAFLSMVKRHYQQDGGSDIRANSLAFHALLALDSWADDPYTMSDLAEKLQIPKQQLTKLINDLETKGLVERTHDTTNRRRVYIRICDTGHTLMEQVKQEMLQSTLHGLRSYSREELLEIDHCICRLTELMEKFNTNPV